MLTSRFINRNKANSATSSSIIKTSLSNFLTNPFKKDYLVVCSPFTSIDINLAIEESLLRAFPLTRQSQLLYLYINSNSSSDNNNNNAGCVVVGRHQNIWSECNLPLCRDTNVQVQRRHSGGGTVYHDQGTLCMSFLTHKEKYAPKKNMQWLDSALRSTTDDERSNISSSSSSSFPLPLLNEKDHSTEIGEKRDDLFINKKKLSGSAMRLAQRAAYHHCTLLVNSDLKNVSAMLHPPKEYKPEFFNSRASESVRSPVANLSEIITTSTKNSNNNNNLLLTSLDVAELLAEKWISSGRNGLPSLSDDETTNSNSSSSIFCLDDNLDELLKTEIKENKKVLTTGSLRDQMLEPSFIFGTSPKFSFNQDFELGGGGGNRISMSFQLDIEKGIVRKVTMLNKKKSLNDEGSQTILAPLEKFIEETLVAGLFEISLYDNHQKIIDTVSTAAEYCYDNYLFVHDEIDAKTLGEMYDEILMNNNNNAVIDVSTSRRKEFCQEVSRKLLERLLKWI